MSRLELRLITKTNSLHLKKTRIVVQKFTKKRAKKEENRYATVQLELTTVGNDNWLLGLARLGADTFDCLDDVHTFDDTSEHDMLAIEPWGFNGADEELGTVGVWSSVGHGEDTFALVLLFTKTAKIKN